MNLLRQLAIICLIYLAGEAVSSILPFPMPGSVISMLLLFLLLFFRFVKRSQIQEVGQFFLKNMAFFFVPAGVAILNYTEMLKEELLPFLAVCVLTTVLTFGVTAWTVTLAVRLQNHRRERK